MRGSVLCLRHDIIILSSQIRDLILCNEYEDYAVAMRRYFLRRALLKTLSSFTEANIMFSLRLSEVYCFVNCVRQPLNTDLTQYSGCTDWEKINITFNSQRFCKPSFLKTEIIYNWILWFILIKPKVYCYIQMKRVSQLIPQLNNIFVYRDKFFPLVLMTQALFIFY